MSPKHFMIRKKEIINDFYKEEGLILYMIIIVQLDSGKKELILNTQDIENKFSYYLSAYDDNLYLKTNPNIKISEWMFVR